MSNTKIVKFGDVIEITPSYNLVKGTVSKYIPMASLGEGQRKIQNIEEREFSGNGTKFINGDTLLARITPCLENGKTAYVDVLGENEVAYGSTEFIVLHGIEGISDNLFVYYLARSENFRRYAIKSMTGSSGRQRVQLNAIKEYEFELPPLEEQKRIAHILGTLDDKIELNQRTNTTLEDIARAVFQSWFVDFDPVRARLAGEPYPLPDEVMALFPDELVNSELGMIPKGWEVKPLDKIASYMNGYAMQKYPPNEGEDYLPVIKIRELRAGATDNNSNHASLDIPEKYIIKDGDVLFSWSGSLLVTLWTGGEGALNQHLFKVTSKSYPKWFYYLWTDYHLSEFQRIAAGKATTMGHIKRSHLSQALAVVPDEKVMTEGDEILSPIIDKIIITYLESQTLGKIRETFLPKLMSGEIEV